MNKYIPNNNQLVVGIDPHEDILGIVYLHNNTIVKGFNIPNCSKQHFDTLISDATSTAKSFCCSATAGLVFVIESTNVFWRPLFSYLTNKGFPVFTVNSYQTNSQRATKMRKTKTDFIDAKNIAELYLQGKAHNTQFPQGFLFDLKELTRFCSFLSDIKGRLLNRIYAFLLQVFPEYSSVFKKRYFSKTLFYLLKHKLFHPTIIANMNPHKLSEIIRKVSHNKFTYKTSQLISIANNSTGIKEGKLAFLIILKFLAQLYQFVSSISNLLCNKYIPQLLQNIPNKLNSIKGLSPLTIASYISELGDYHRFKNADDVVAFFGLDPSLRQSGRRNGQGKHISKSGTKFGRESMFLAVTPVILHNPVFKQRFFNLKKQGRNSIDAKTIIAADLVKICFAMLRDNSEFQPNKVN